MLGYLLAIVAGLALPGGVTAYVVRKDRASQAAQAAPVEAQLASAQSADVVASAQAAASVSEIQADNEDAATLAGLASQAQDAEQQDLAIYQQATKNETANQAKAFFAPLLNAFGIKI